MLRSSLLAALVVYGACGGGDPTISTPDGGHDAPPDAPESLAACGEFGVAGVTLPAHVTGQLAGADLESPATCATVDAPFGIESAGPDSVVRIDGLVAGNIYVVKLASQSDLAFYVATGCGTPTGPSAAQCLLFVDETKAGEIGTFVAPAPTAFIVVDYYAATPPADLAFTLDVYADGCDTSATCTAPGAGVCLDHQCVECASSFDCTAAAASRCDAPSHACVPGTDACTTDDDAEPADDGPAGATVLAAGASVDHTICASPLDGEVDYYAFDVAAVGEDWTIALAWMGARDLDLEILDATGAVVGLSYWEQPEHAEVTDLTPGRYYARVTEFASSVNPAAIGYTISTTRTMFPTGCTSSHDCAETYRNQIYRGACVAGSCVALDGNGAVPEGGACDSQSDCSAGLHCPSFFFVADADTRETCQRECTNDSQCDPGDVCTTYLSPNFCVPRCTSTEQCATDIDDKPHAGPWVRLTCEQSTGRCLP